jgi:hypothetical protein
MGYKFRIRAVAIALLCALIHTFRVLLCSVSNVFCLFVNGSTPVAHSGYFGRIDPTSEIKVRFFDIRLVSEVEFPPNVYLNHGPELLLQCDL